MIDALSTSDDRVGESRFDTAYNDQNLVTNRARLKLNHDLTHKAPLFGLPPEVIFCNWLETNFMELRGLTTGV